jgi:hypothetical protein
MILLMPADPQNRNQCRGAGQIVYSYTPRDEFGRVKCPYCDRFIKVGKNGCWYRHQVPRSPQAQKAIDKAKHARRSLKKAGEIMKTADLSDFEREILRDALSEIREVAAAGREVLKK